MIATRYFFGESQHDESDEAAHDNDHDDFDFAVDVAFVFVGKLVERSGQVPALLSHGHEACHDLGEKGLVCEGFAQEVSVSHGQRHGSHRQDLCRRPGIPIYEKLENRDLVYVVFTLQKPP